MRNVLTIAGSDSCGGAGIQADLKTFSALGTYGLSAVTAVTAQNTQGVVKVAEMSADMVREQIDCLFDDIPIHAVKIGMVSSTEIICAIGDCLKSRPHIPIVLDPVMVSKSGCSLLQLEAKERLIKVLIPLADIVTPNLLEAQELTGITIRSTDEMQEAAVMIHKLGVQTVVVKGGHKSGDCTDVVYDGFKFTHYPAERIHTPHTHGTGCTFSSAIAAYLARQFTIDQAIYEAKQYTRQAIINSFRLGQGHGPTHHFYELYSKAGVCSE